tara:strand:- start:1171 stop:1359 length:189 start_codon:yes stop_codon:yes gene_type:complete
LPSKNPVTEAITSVIDEYKLLVKESAKKENRTPRISPAGESQALLEKMLAKNNLSIDEFRRP